MKKLILFLILLCSFITYGQITPPKDTSNISIPYNMAQQMLLDLNEYDKLKELSILDKEEIKQYNSKITLLESSLLLWEKKDNLNQQIITGVEEKFDIINNQNDGLRKDIKKLKAKNTFITILGGTILTTLTVFMAIK